MSQFEQRFIFRRVYCTDTHKWVRFKYLWVHIMQFEMNWDLQGPVEIAFYEQRPA